MGPTELEMSGLVAEMVGGVGNLPAGLPGTPCWSKPRGWALWKGWAHSWVAQL